MIFVFSMFLLGLTVSVVHVPNVLKVLRSSLCFYLHKLLFATLPVGLQSTKKSCPKYIYELFVKCQVTRDMLA